MFTPPTRQSCGGARDAQLLQHDGFGFRRIAPDLLSDSRQRLQVGEVHCPYLCCVDLSIAADCAEIAVDQGGVEQCGNPVYFVLGQLAVGMVNVVDVVLNCRRREKGKSALSKASGGQPSLLFLGAESLDQDIVLCGNQQAQRTLAALEGFMLPVLCQRPRRGERFDVVRMEQGNSSLVGCVSAAGIPSPETGQRGQLRYASPFQRSGAGRIRPTA